MNHLDVILEPEQTKLLQILVEAHRITTERESFQWDCDRFEFNIYHTGLHGYKRNAHEPDVRILERAGLIFFDGGTFNLEPLAFRYYERLKRESGESCARIEDTVRTFLNGALLQQVCPKAYEQWAKAEKALWAQDAEMHLTEIGHHCREAIQEFATAAVSHFRPSEIDLDITHTVKRIQTLLNLRRSQLGKTKHALFDALLVYWGTVSDVIQRQEHGGQKEGEPLVWEDGRRVVFQTAILMFECSDALFKNTHRSAKVRGNSC